MGEEEGKYWPQNPFAACPFKTIPFTPDVCTTPHVLAVNDEGEEKADNSHNHVRELH